MRKDNPFEKYLTKEQREHKAIVEYIRFHPKLKNLLWAHPVNEGKRTPFERYLWVIMGGQENLPDFIFWEPNDDYAGLAIELKAEGTRLFKKNGDCYFPEQYAMLQRFKAKGYKAELIAGKDTLIDLLKEYFGITR